MYLDDTPIKDILKLLVIDKTTNRIHPKAHRGLSKDDLGAAFFPSTKTYERVAISFGARRESKSNRTWKQYFTELYNKLSLKFCKFINAVNSLFKKPSKNQAELNRHKDPSISLASLKPSVINPTSDHQFSEMTRAQRTQNINRLIKQAADGKAYIDLCADDQNFLYTFIRKAMSQSDPDDQEIAKGLTDLYDLPKEEN